MTRRRRRTIAFVALLSLVVAIALAKVWSNSSGRTVHEDGDGPLSATSTAGGVGVLAPRGRRYWSGSFGALLLCVTGRERVHLEGVRIQAAPGPLSASFRLRRVPLPRDRTGSAEEWEPFYSSQGTWPHLHVGPLRGEVGPFGGVIDQPCEGPDGVLHRFTELIVQLSTGPQGAQITHTLIDYRVGSRRYTLRVNWQMVLCGSETKQTCDGNGR